MAKYVYIILRDGPDGPSISGVYSTKKKAEKAIEDTKKGYYAPDQYTWEVEKAEVR